MLLGDLMTSACYHEIVPQRSNRGLERKRNQPPIQCLIGVHRRPKMLPSFGTGVRAGCRNAIFSNRARYRSYGIIAPAYRTKFRASISLFRN